MTEKKCKYRQEKNHSGLGTSLTHKHLGLIKLFLNQQFRRHRLLPIFQNWCNFLDVCEGDVPSWIVGKNYFRRGSTEKKIIRSYYTELD